MKTVKDWLIALVVLLFGRRAEPHERAEAPERIVPPGPPDRPAELAVILLLLAAAAGSVAFVVIYALDRLPAQTQLLGLSLALTFGFLAAACILVGKRLVATEELPEQYPAPERPEDQGVLEQLVAESGDRLTRKRLLILAGGAAGGALGLALITPALSMGPALDVGAFYDTPWRRGRRLVDENGRPYRARDIEEKLFYTAFPAGADREQLGAPIVLVRIDPAQLQLPPDRVNWAPGGILAFSKICTHAGCAINLYGAPLFPEVEPGPALVCPCHYSTFDPATGGTVLFGPAGRPLPQLPLLLGSDGLLLAGGNFSDPVGPSWWGVRLHGPETGPT